LFHKTAGNTHCRIIWYNATRFSVYRKDEKLYDATYFFKSYHTLQNLNVDPKSKGVLPAEIAENTENGITEIRNFGIFKRANFMAFGISRFPAISLLFTTINHIMVFGLPEKDIPNLNIISLFI